MSSVRISLLVSIANVCAFRAFSRRSVHTACTSRFLYHHEHTKEHGYFEKLLFDSVTNAVEFLVDTSKPSLILSLNVFNHSMYLALNLMLLLSNALLTFSQFVIVPLKNLRSDSGSSFRRIICSSSKQIWQYPLILGLVLLPFCLPLRNTLHDKPNTLSIEQHDLLPVLCRRHPADRQNYLPQPSLRLHTIPR